MKEKSGLQTDDAQERKSSKLYNFQDHLDLYVFSKDKPYKLEDDQMRKTASQKHLYRPKRSSQSPDIAKQEETVSALDELKANSRSRIKVGSQSSQSRSRGGSPDKSASHLYLTELPPA